MLGLDVYFEITERLLLALAVGSAIGFERSYHGRAAGFRTHALVSLSTALLMLITVYEAYWFTPGTGARTTLDPTRMAQGIMTGIGFMGAGAILKESMTIRGLTTAASIWITAALGVMVGAGMLFPAALSTALTLGTLSVFRWVERKMPAQTYAIFRVRFDPGALLSEQELRQLMERHGFTTAHLSYHLNATEATFEYTMTIRTERADNLRQLAQTLAGLSSIRAFHLTPLGS